MKEDRSLMQRIIVISQKLQKISLSMHIGKYEFSVSPRSLFSFDEKVHPCTGKSKLHALEDKAREMEMRVEEESLSGSNLKVVIYDGMALVNKLEIRKDVKTCKELMKHIFADRLIKQSEDFHEVRLVFNRYIEGSLKERTREKGSGGKATRYIIKDSMPLVGVKM